MGGRGEWGHNNSVRFPKDDSQIKHIFRNDEGHIIDSQAIRMQLLETAKNEANYVGSNRFNCRWYAREIGQGKQLWISVRNGIVQNAGINEPPITDWSFLEARK
ncbi:MAG: hypothetical protein LBS91_01645 [Clostridiales Family XIII bacterium]|jgi:filamentous hemagglutinin|nr:hypothetical protein [Clostridiales Family XIII bacterium]